MSNTPCNYNGSHTPANLSNALGACLADAQYLMNELPPGRMQRNRPRHERQAPVVCRTPRRAGKEASNQGGNMSPQEHINLGNRYPFEETDHWWHASEGDPLDPQDWANSAARGIISSLQERKGIKKELDVHNIGEKTRKEIIAEIAAIIRTSVGQNTPLFK